MLWGLGSHNLLDGDVWAKPLCHQLCSSQRHLNCLFVGCPCERCSECRLGRITAGLSSARGCKRATQRLPLWWRALPGMAHAAPASSGLAEDRELVPHIMSDLLLFECVRVSVCERGCQSMLCMFVCLTV